MKSTVFLVLLSLGAHAQGPLTPPPIADPAVGPINALDGGGAPQATMKTLHQVEPRKPINTLPATISESGSYYFTGNLEFTAATGDAITIAANDVAIDLNGFTLSSDAGVTGSGIHINSEVRGVRISNGHIKGATTRTGTGLSGTFSKAGFLYGISGLDSISTMVEKAQVFACREQGIRTTSASIRDCRASGNGGGGVINFSGAVVDCYAEGNQSTGILGNRVSRCTARSNFGDGISASGVVEHSIADTNGGAGIAGIDVSISHCQAFNNNSIGINIITGSVSYCSVKNNSSYGIFSSGSELFGEGVTISHCNATGNNRAGIHADRSTITACTATLNGSAATLAERNGAGIRSVGGLITGCTARGNHQNGIYSPEGLVNGCRTAGNSLTGTWTQLFVGADGPYTAGLQINNF